MSSENEFLTREDVVRLLREAQGDNTTHTFASNTLNCSSSHLYEVYGGTRNPGYRLLDELGLEKVVVYRKKRWR